VRQRSDSDDDGNETRWTYDFANRVLETVDAEGRFERKTYDGQGQVVLEEAGHKGSGSETVHLTRESKGYDGLGRSLGVSETFGAPAHPSGFPSIPKTGSVYETDIAFDDLTHTVAVRDRRGFVTVRKLDDLDRVYEETVDAAEAALGREGDPRAGAALGLVTRFEYDAGGNRSAATDPEGRRTEEVYDGLGRLIERRLPMGFAETFAYDGDGRVIQKTDARGVTSLHELRSVRPADGGAAAGRGTGHEHRGAQPELPR
jgi:YD repeat-containing protein